MNNLAHQKPFHYIYVYIRNKNKTKIITMSNEEYIPAKYIENSINRIKKILNKDNIHPIEKINLEYALSLFEIDYKQRKTLNQLNQPPCQP